MRALTRRSVLRGGAAALPVAALAACSDNEPTVPSFVAPDSERVTAAEAARNPGTIREFQLNPVASEVDLGGLVVPTWSYGGVIPGSPIRVNRGEQVKAVVSNGLPEATTVHWHGLQMRCDADGVPDLTQAPIAPGATYTYQFTAPDAGTYWFHPHMGTQLDRGLYAPLIIDDPDEAVTWDLEWTVVLDDWMDGVTGTPDDVLAELAQGMNMDEVGSGGGHDGHGQAPTGDSFLLHGAESDLLGADAGDVATRTTSSTAACRPTRRSSRPNPVRACGSGSSTPEPTPPTGWPCRATGSPSRTLTGSLACRSKPTRS